MWWFMNIRNIRGRFWLLIYKKLRIVGISGNWRPMVKGRLGWQEAGIKADPLRVLSLEFPIGLGVFTAMGGQGAYYKLP